MNDAVTLTLPQAIQHAAAAFNKGEWAKAEHLARLILNAQADHFDALNLLGIMAAQTRRPEEAADLFRRAVAARPTDAAAHSNYGNSLNDLKRFEEALDSYAHTLRVRPDCDWSYGNWLHLKLSFCDWSNFDSQIADLAAKIQRAEVIAFSFGPDTQDEIRRRMV